MGASDSLVLQLGTATPEGRLDTVTLWWADGEPAFEQVIPLDVTWDADACHAR